MNDYLKSIKNRDPAAKSILSIILTYPGVKAVFFHQISNFFYIAGFDIVSRIVSQTVRFFTGIEIHPGAIIGKNLFSSIPCGTYFTAQSGFGCFLSTFLTKFLVCLLIQSNISSER